MNYADAFIGQLLNWMGQSAAAGGPPITGYQLGAELLNFGASVAFMGVNASAFVRYFVRAERKTVGNFLLPLLGFVVCLYIWWSLRTPAKIVGMVWLASGLLYGAWKPTGSPAKSNSPCRTKTRPQPPQTADRKEATASFENGQSQTDTDNRRGWRDISRAHAEHPESTHPSAPTPQHSNCLLPPPTAPVIPASLTVRRLALRARTVRMPISSLLCAWTSSTC